MDTARIAALLQPFLEPSRLDPAQLDQISIYIDLLQRWNARINLTAIRNENEIVTRHFGESFFLARHLFPKGTQAGRSNEGETDASGSDAGEPHTPPAPAGSTGNRQLATGNCCHVLDIGSGAGFPALPLKIWAPAIRLTLIESNHKKATFLREAARALTLTNINVITDRAETYAKQIQAHPENYPNMTRPDIVTLRAVEHFESILQTAATLLPPTGRLALLIGTTQLPHLTTLSTLTWSDPIHVPESHSRELLIGIQM
jgi:16S rRNA (guanine527-N7)-methyltransferase